MRASGEGHVHMQHLGFYERAGPYTLAALTVHLGLETVPSGDILIEDVKALADAGPTDVTFFNNIKYLDELTATRAGACLVAREYADKLPATTVPLIVPQPYEAFAAILFKFYPDSDRPLTTRAGEPEISPSAVIEDDVVIEPSVIIGPEAQIGRGTRLAAGAVIGYRCTIGRNCYIGPRVSVGHALIGDNVTIHAGASIGQDGFGFAMGPTGHKRVPQIGRVIIQDDVDIGANSTIDRGALNDTTIGQGTKIDNLVQIAHNVTIGRHCVIAAMAGVAGSSELGEFVVMGGKAAVSGHLKIGAGAQLAGASSAIANIPAGARVGGTPARPYRQWAREQTVLRRLVKDASRG